LLRIDAYRSSKLSRVELIARADLMVEHVQIGLGRIELPGEPGPNPVA
jgi:hypothetical protein